jgi:DNA-binding protein YbaB
MGDVPGRPDWSVVRTMLGDLRKATAELPNIQRRMMAVTGTAWSPDGMIKAVVGPRGHLMELDIDPRLLRQPNSKALSATIVATVRAAVEDAGRQSAEIADSTVPPDLRGRRPEGGLDVSAYLRTHDADVLVKKDGNDE